MYKSLSFKSAISYNKEKPQKPLSEAFFSNLFWCKFRESAKNKF